MTAQQQETIANVIANSLSAHPPAAGGMPGTGVGTANMASAPQNYGGDLKNFPKLSKALSEMDPPERAKLTPEAIYAVSSVGPDELAVFKQAGVDFDGKLARKFAAQAQFYKSQRTGTSASATGITTTPPSTEAIPKSAPGSSSQQMPINEKLQYFPKLRKVLAEMDPAERKRLMPVALDAVARMSQTDLVMSRGAGVDVDGMLARQIAGYAQNFKRGRLDERNQQGPIIEHTRASKTASKAGIRATSSNPIIH